MEERDKLIILYDFYSELLTDKQKEYFEDYYFSNLSLGEIRENTGLSRNAIHKNIKTVEEKLYFYEEKLELYKKKILLEKPYYPGHMHEMLQIWHRLMVVRPNYVLEELLNRGVLQPLTEEQKKGVMIIAYSDILPTQDM